MCANLQRLKEKGYKKQRAAKELGIDRKTVRKYWDMEETEYACYHLETKERTKIMDPLHHPKEPCDCMYVIYGKLKVSLHHQRYGNTAKARNYLLDSRRRYIWGKK